MPTSDPAVLNNSTDFGNYTLPANTTIWGPIPDDNRRSRQPDIIACSIICWVISLTFVILRFYTRGRLNHVLGPTDWCIIPALLCAAGVAASAIEQAARGAGKHSWQIDIYGLPALERAAWYGMLFYALSLTFTRISILLLYKRIFTYNWAKRAIQITLALVIMMGIWFVVAVCTACVPLEAFWNWSLFWTEKVYCQPYQIWWANSALHLAADFAIMALPMPILSTLKLPKRQKYALIGVFALGFFVCIISILRLVALVDITQASPIDSAYSTADLIYWTAVEINASIVCACAMTLKPLIQRLFPRMLSPSRYVNDQSLQWITPISNNRNSRHSFVNRPGASHPRRSASHRSHRSAPSDGGSHSTKFGGGSILPRVEEREHRRRDEYDDYYPTSREELLVGELKSDDIEKQERSDSVLTGAAAASAPRDSTSLDLFFRPTGELTAPPRAHLRLSIHVTKSVHVTKTPSSPVPGEKEEEASGPLPSATFGQRMG